MAYAIPARHQYKDGTMVFTSKPIFGTERVWAVLKHDCKVCGMTEDHEYHRRLRVA